MAVLLVIAPFLRWPHRNMAGFHDLCPMKLSLWPLLTIVVLLGCSDPAQQPPTTPPPPPPAVTYTDPPQFGTPFVNVPETKDIVMYEVNLRAFSTQGTFAGVTARLDSIKALGANTIWLMPIYPVGVLNSVGQLGSPYAVRNYKEVNTEFGTIDDLRTLVSTAHAKDMTVILDWVANHTSWDNPWIVNTSWYTLNSFGAITIPAGTNWNDVADLNFSSAAMRRAMINAMKYWVLAANVDGYRCDYADGVPFDFWKQALDSLKAIPNRELILLAEGARGDHFIAGYKLNYAWNFFGALYEIFNNSQSASSLVTANASEQAGLPAGSFKLRFTANHDEVAWNDTPQGLFGGKDGSMAAFVLASYMGGVPLLYNGQEIGYPVKLPFFSKSPIDWLTADWAMLKTYKKLLAFRKTSDAVKAGAIEAYAHNDVVAFKRISGVDEVLVIVNTRNITVNYTLDAAVANTNWFDVMNNNAAVGLTTTLSLAPYEYTILKK